MEILDLRHFSSADLRPLLQDEISVWAQLLSWDYSGSAEMILRYLDSKILPGYAAIERGNVFGYSFFVYEQSKGVIGDLFVRNGSRTPNRHEVEEKLLSHVIETLQQSPGIQRVEAQLLAHETGEVVRPFQQQGFSRNSGDMLSVTRLRLTRSDARSFCPTVVSGMCGEPSSEIIVCSVALERFLLMGSRVAKSTRCM